MKKKIFVYLQKNIFPFIVQCLIRLIYLTNKKTFHHPTDKNKQAFISAIWHGDLIMQTFNYKKYKPNGLVKAMISEHRDGETIRKVLKYLGIDSISGSSTRGGVKALVNGIKTLKQDIDIAITPDGPQGPIYSIADGIVMLAQKTHTPIRVFSSIPSKYWQFNSWDKFIVPKPFGSIDFYISEPFDLDGLSLEEAKEKIKQNMMQNQLDK